VVELSAASAVASRYPVVVAVGGYRVPTIPRIAKRLPPHITQMSSSAYWRPDALPDGDVLGAADRPLVGRPRSAGIVSGA
jgi:putative flavoprotein involved in K+ transport